MDGRRKTNSILKKSRELKLDSDQCQQTMYIHYYWPLFVPKNRLRDHLCIYLQQKFNYHKNRKLRPLALPSYFTWNTFPTNNNNHNPWMETIIGNSIKQPKTNQNKETKKLKKKSS